MKHFKVLPVVLALVAMGCSSDENGVAPPPPKNTVPTITFTFGKIAVAKSTDVTLTVDVDDADGDPVTVTWEVTRGLLNAPDQGSPSMLWTTAGTVGSDTLTITASDGKGGSKTIQEIIEVGTLRTSNVMTPQTWTLLGSPYIVSPATDILGITSRLTIEAGVVVYIDKAASSIHVEGGELWITGTAAAPVVIQPSARNPQAGSWEGVLAKGSGPLLDFEYATISHARHAIRAINSGRIRVTNCNIVLCSEAAIFHNATGELIVENSAITNNIKSGIRVEESITNPPAYITIRGDSIAVNGRFKDSEVYVDGEAGISIDLDDQFGAVPIEISGNEISRNDFPGIRLITAVYPVITGNGIFGNELRKVTGKVNIELIAPFGAGGITEIHATNNWWGQNYPPDDSLTIKAGIVDADDSSQIDTNVWVEPWLTFWPQ
jgi:parallel beta-helix repeat protein